MNLNKRQQMLAIVAIVAVGFFVADKLIFTPLVNAWKARSAHIVKLKSDVNDATMRSKSERSWRDQWSNMQSNTLAADKQVAEGQMLQAFERWARNGSVTVSSVRPQWKESDDDYKTLECRADVAGNLETIAHFLFQIERDPMGVKVDSMELTSHATDGSQLVLVVQVSGLLINPPRQSLQSSK